MRNVAVRNISIPDAMNEEMRERDDVNWSGVAQRAFRRELAKSGDVARALAKLTPRERRLLGL